MTKPHTPGQTTPYQIRQAYNHAVAELIVDRVRPVALADDCYDEPISPLVHMYLADAFDVPLRAVERAARMHRGRLLKQRGFPMPPEASETARHIQQDLYPLVTTLADGVPDLRAPALAERRCDTLLNQVGLVPHARADVMGLVGHVVTGTRPRDFAHVRGLHYYATQPAVREAVDRSLEDAALMQAQARLRSQVRLAGWA